MGCGVMVENCIVIKCARYEVVCVVMSEECRVAG